MTETETAYHSPPQGEHHLRLVRIAYQPLSDLEHWLCDDHNVWSSSTLRDSLLGPLDTFLGYWSDTSRNPGKLTAAGRAAVSMLRLPRTSCEDLAFHAVNHFGLSAEHAGVLASCITACGGAPHS